MGYIPTLFNDSIAQGVWTCRSHDIVAHEAGHAVLDSLQPDWKTLRGDQPSPENHALHEAFADITCIFSLLDQMDVCEAAMAHTKGSLPPS